MLFIPCRSPVLFPPRSNALKTRLGQLGFDLPDEQLNDVFKRFKNLADRKKVSYVWFLFVCFQYF